MPELSEITVNSPSPEMASILENLQKQKLNSTTNSRQNVINSSTSTSSVKELSTSSQQVNSIYRFIIFILCENVMYSLITHLFKF